jgi:dTDP-glucose pyrophosphorylase
MIITHSQLYRNLSYINISTPKAISRFEALLCDGSQCDINLDYKVQLILDGWLQTFLTGIDLIGEGSFVMILGDNI